MAFLYMFKMCADGIPNQCLGLISMDHFLSCKYFSLSGSDQTATEEALLPRLDNEHSRKEPGKKAMDIELLFTTGFCSVNKRIQLQIIAAVQHLSLYGCTLNQLNGISSGSSFKVLILLKGYIHFKESDLPKTLCKTSSQSGDLE